MLDAATMAEAAKVVHHTMVTGGSHTVTYRNFTTRFQEDIINAAIWSAVGAGLTFLWVYTFGPARCKWWKNVAGQTIVALDVALLFLFVPQAMTLVHPAFVYESWHTYLSIVAVWTVPAVALYRTFALIRHALRKRKLGTDTGSG